MARTASITADRIAAAPPAAYFVGSAVFHYLGPAFAVLLFARVEPLGVAWFRVVSAGAAFALWRHPWRALRGATPETWRLVVGFGAVLAVMNACFYIAIDRLPLGTVAAIEFLPVIVLAALGVRTPATWPPSCSRSPASTRSSTSGSTASRSELRSPSRTPSCSRRYIVLAHRVAREPGPATDRRARRGDARRGGRDSDRLRERGAGPARPDRVVAGIGVGLASSVIPYVFDQLAMARLSRSGYAMMVALLPATATVIGIVVLAQIPSAVEIAGVALVVAAMTLRSEADAV